MGSPLEVLVSALSKTVELDDEERKNAERFLEESSVQTGFCPLLLRIAVDMSLEIPSHIKLSSAVYLKNTIGRLWRDKLDKDTEGPQYTISPEDKTLIRAGIIDALVLTEDNTRMPLCYCLELISRSDFPRVWTDLVLRLRGYLETDSVPQWRGAALALYQIGRKYQFKADNERGEFLGLIQTLLPLLYQRCRTLVEQEDELSYYVQHYVLKSIYYVVNCHLPLSIFQDHILHQWFPYWMCVIGKSVPTVDATLTEENRAGAQWWKCKKWALRTLYQLIVKYFDLDDKRHLRFKKFFTQHYSEKVVSLILQQLDLHVKGCTMTDATLQTSLSYLAYSISHAVSWKLIKPNFEALFLALVFPLMCHSHRDQQMWDEDPAEYIRIRFDIFDDFLSPVSAAESLLQECMQKRRGMLNMVLQHCMRVLAAQGEEWNAQNTDGALHVISCACEAIYEQKSLRQEIEGLFVRFVYPLFTSPTAYLRARACWMFHSFNKLHLSTPNLHQAIQGLISCLMNETELPVRVEAAIGLLSLFEDHEESVDIIKPFVASLLRELLVLIKETENDDIADALRDIIRIYGEDISGIAVDLCSSLVQTFSEIYDINADSPDVQIASTLPEIGIDEGEFSKSLVAMGILNSILSLLNVMSENLPLLSQLEQCIGKLMVYLLKTGLLDLYEEVFQIIERLTDDQISPGMWELLFLIYECFQRDAFDYFPSIMPTLYNYVSVDEDTFLSNPKYVECIIDMCTGVLERSEEENSQQYACKMLEIILLNLKGKVNAWLPAILTPPMRKLTQSTQTPELRSQCFIVVIAALFTSPDIVLQLLESTRFPNCNESVTSQLLCRWIENPDELEGIHDRKISILSLCSLLQSGTAIQLACFQKLAPIIIPNMVSILNQLVKAYEEDKNSDVSGSDDAGSGLNSDVDTDVASKSIVSDGEDVLDDEDDVKEFQRLLKRAGGEEEYSSESSDHDIDTLQKTELESEYETLVDVDQDYDEFIAFKLMIESISQQNQQWYAILTSQITLELQEQVQSIFKLSDQHWQEIQESKQNNPEETQVTNSQ